MTERPPIAFFCRAKPQQSDAWPIFRDARRVFIGYPMVRKGAEYDPQNLAHCLVNPACADEEWNDQASRKDYTKQYAANRNLVRAVTPGSIALIPRPESGLVHLARIAADFEIVNSPAWLEAYMALREKQGAYLDEWGNQHAADVAQGWPVGPWMSLPLASVPGWIRRSLFGRSTYGRLYNHPKDESVSAYDTLTGLLDSGGQSALPEPTASIEVIKRRLVDTLTAGAFEHLVVNLLQLEHTDEMWVHTGGPGDGGVDGMGIGPDGGVAAILQCKLYGRHLPWPISEGNEPGVRRIFAVLVEDGPTPSEDGVIRLGADEIARLVLKHAERLPEAKSMRIGSP